MNTLDLVYQFGVNIDFFFVFDRLYSS